MAVCTNNKVGYRPISFYGLMTRVATGSKFGMIFFLRVRKERCVRYGMSLRSDVKLHSSMGCHQVAFFPDRFLSMPGAITDFTFVVAVKLIILFLSVRRTNNYMELCSIRWSVLSCWDSDPQII